MLFGLTKLLAIGLWPAKVRNRETRKCLLVSARFYRASAAPYAGSLFVNVEDIRMAGSWGRGWFLSAVE